MTTDRTPHHCACHNRQYYGRICYLCRFGPEREGFRVSSRHGQPGEPLTPQASASLDKRAVRSIGEGSPGGRNGEPRLRTVTERDLMHARSREPGLEGVT